MNLKITLAFSLIISTANCKLMFINLLFAHICYNSLVSGFNQV